MGSRRIVITETGVMSCMGIGLEKLGAGLATPPAVSSVKDFEFHQFEEPLPCHLVKGFDPVEVLGKKGLRNKDNATKMLLGTLDSGLKIPMENLDEQNRPGLCIGTAFGSVQSIGDFLSDSIVNGVNNVNPQAFANTVINSPTGNANIRYLARNLSATIATSFNAGLDAIIYAYDYLSRGYLTRLVAGGLEEISYYSLLGLQRSSVLSASGTARPFATDADGCVMGEGCALFLLETQEAASSRGAKLLAEIIGVASGFDPEASQNGISNGETGARVISRALSDANIPASTLGFVASGANGNPITDALESAAISRATGGSVPVTAYKALTGECYGASGALNMMCALSDLKHGRITGSGATYTTTGAVPLVTTTLQKTSEYALVVSFSCEGHCSAVVLKNCS